MLMHAIAHGGCADTVRESALKADCGTEKENLGLEPASVLRLAFQSDVLHTELSPPLAGIDRVRSVYNVT